MRRHSQPIPGAALLAMDARIPPPRAPKPPALRAIWWLLRDLTLPSLRRHRLRTALTLVGVVLGVQLFVTIRLIDRATLRSFEHITRLVGIES